jgi:predicted transcriptional regulator
MRMNHAHGVCKKAFLIFAILLIVVNLKLACADSPPSIPAVIYGTVYNDEGVALQGISVTASWTRNGEVMQKTVRTMTREESESSGNSFQAGTYRFDEGVYVNGQTKVKIESEGTAIEVDVGPGTVTSAPSIVIPKRASAAGQISENILPNQGVLGAAFDYFAELFKSSEFNGGNSTEINNPKEPNTENEYSSGEGTGSGYGTASEGFPGEGEDWSNGEFSTEVGDFNGKSGNLSGTSRNLSKGNYSYNKNSTREEPVKQAKAVWWQIFKKDSSNKNNEKNILELPKDLFNLKYLIFPSEYEKQDSRRTNLIFLYVLAGVILISLVIFFWTRLFKKTVEKNLEKYPYRINLMSCDDLTLKKVASLSPKDSFLEAIDIFIKEGGSCIPIVSENKISGVVRIKDLLAKMDDTNQDLLEKTELSKIANKDFVSCDISTKVIDCCKLMLDKGRDELIVEKKGAFMGVINVFDILELMGKMKIEVENPPILKEVMNVNILTISKDETVENLKDILIAKNSNYALVMGSGKVEGIVTCKDVLSALSKSSIAGLKTVSIMSSTPVSLKPWNSLFEAVKIMIERKYNQIPLISENKVVGIVNIQSVMKLYYETLSELITGAKYS